MPIDNFVPGISEEVFRSKTWNTKVKCYFCILIRGHFPFAATHWLTGAQLLGVENLGFTWWGCKLVGSQGQGQGTAHIQSCNSFNYWDATASHHKFFISIVIHIQERKSTSAENRKTSFTKNVSLIFLRYLIFWKKENKHFSTLIMCSAVAVKQETRIMSQLPNTSFTVPSSATLSYCSYSTSRYISFPY